MVGWLWLGFAWLRLCLLGVGLALGWVGFVLAWLGLGWLWVRLALAWVGFGLALDVCNSSLSFNFWKQTLCIFGG